MDDRLTHDAGAPSPEEISRTIDALNTNLVELNASLLALVPRLERQDLTPEQRIAVRTYVEALIAVLNDARPHIDHALEILRSTDTPPPA